MKTPDLFKAAQDRVDKLFGDTSVSQQKTLEMLEELRDELDMKIRCIKNDLGIK